MTTSQSCEITIGQEDFKKPKDAPRLPSEKRGIRFRERMKRVKQNTKRSVAVTGTVMIRA
jgi:hypothetical protein